MPGLSQGKKINSTGVPRARPAVPDLLLTLALPGRVTFYVLDYSWPLGDGLCRLTVLLLYVNPYGGVYLRACVSPDRHLAVVRAHQCPRLRKASRARLVCVAPWALALPQTAPLQFIPTTKWVAGTLTCMEYDSVEGILRLPLGVLAACALSFCGPVGIILFCYRKITLKLCRTARRACLLTLVALVAVVAVVVCFSPYHLNISRIMPRETLRPPSCPEQGAFRLSLQLTVPLMNVNWH